MKYLCLASKTIAEDMPILLHAHIAEWTFYISEYYSILNFDTKKNLISPNKTSSVKIILTWITLL